METERKAPKRKIQSDDSPASKTAREEAAPPIASTSSSVTTAPTPSTSDASSIRTPFDDSISIDEPPRKIIDPVQPPGRFSSKQAKLTEAIQRIPRLYNPSAYRPIEVNSEDYNIYFGTLYNSITRALFREGPQYPIITMADFQTVCRFLLKGRVDYVYSVVTGYRPTDRITVPGSKTVPKALGDIINAIGTISMSQGKWSLAPMSPPPPVDRATYLVSLVTNALMLSFDSLVQAAVNAGVIRGTTIGRHTPGTAFWVLGAYAANNQPAAGNTAAVRIRCTSKTFTPADCYLAAIVQNRQTGTLPDSTTHLWESQLIVGVPHLRDSYNLSS